MTLALDRPSAAPAVDTHWGDAADEATIQRTAEALRSHGMDVIVVDTADDARLSVLGLIPEGAEVHQGASVTLDEAGITAEIVESGRYDAVRPKIWSLDRATQGREIASLGATPQVMLGSAHAVTETGSLLFASNTGSQLPAYAAGAEKVIWVVGSQKIVPTLEDGLRRLSEYSYQLEDVRAQQAYGVHTAMNTVLIVNGQPRGRATVVLVREPIGY